MTAPLRILALITDADEAPGGIAQFNRDMLDAFATDAQVARVDVVSLTRFRPRRPPPRATVRLLPTTPSRVRFSLRAIGAAKRGAYDLVWCGHLNLAPIARLAARRARCPFWLTTHGIEAWDAPRGWRGRAARDADGITAVSRHTRGRVLAWWAGDPVDARVVANTVAPRYTPGADGALAGALARWQLHDNDVVLTVGRLAAGERYKGHDRVIEALPALRAAHPRLVYVIAGDGDDRPRLEALARQLGVDEHVHFVGHVAANDLPSLYRCARAFAMPSTGEGFGIAFLEAMACGVPAVGLDGDGSRDPLRDGALGFVSDEAGLVDAITRALSRDARRGAALAAATREAFGETPFRRQVSHWLAHVAAVR